MCIHESPPTTWAALYTRCILILDTQLQQTTPDVISDTKASSVWSERINRTGHRASVVPWFPVSCEGLTSRASHISQDRPRTHMFTPFSHGSKYTIIPVNHQPLELTHHGEPCCAHGHTQPTLPLPTVHTHMRTLTITSALQIAHSHFSFAQDVMKPCWWNLVKVSESPLSHSHTHTSPGTYTCTSSCQGLKLSSVPVPWYSCEEPAGNRTVALSEEPRPALIQFSTPVALSGVLVSQPREEEEDKKKWWRKRIRDGYDRHFRKWPGWDDARGGRGRLLWGR